MNIDPIKRGTDSRKNWETINRLLTEIDGLKRRVYQLEHPNTRRLITTGSGRLGFFTITQGSTWLKAQVSNSMILTTGDIITPTNADTDLTLTTATAKNWIYVDLTATTATFAASATLPTWAADKIVLGYVDTTNTTDSVQRIEQIRYEHIISPCV